LDHGTGSRSQILIEATSTVPAEHKVSLVVTGGDCPVALELVDATFDDVALLVGLGVE
jgi:hypothetical protein